MSYYRCSLGVISRKDGGSALRRSAYQRCTRSECGKYDFSEKSDEYVGHEVLLPEGAPKEFRDPDYLWSEADKMDTRVNSTISRTVELAIPDEVPEELWFEFANELMSFYRDHGVAVEYSIQRDEGVTRIEDNNHIHGMISTRRLRPDGFSEHKHRDFEKNVMRARRGRYVREVMADMMNDFFQRYGIDAEVDHKMKENRDDVVPVMEDKKIIKEIKRHKKAIRAHVDAGGKLSDYPGTLSGKAQRFLSDLEIFRAEQQLKKIKENDKKSAFHSALSGDVWNAAELVGERAFEARQQPSFGQ